MVDYIDLPWGPVKAGETFTVIGKLTSGYAGGRDVPTMFRGERFTLPYESLEPVVELVSGTEGSGPTSGASIDEKQSD